VALAPDEMRRALASIAAWRADAARPAPCPRCGERALTVVDRSARPHAEWYALDCARCGLSETVAVPLGRAAPSLD